MVFLDGGRHLTHCGKPSCGMKITASDKPHNVWKMDTNRYEYSDLDCEGMQPKWQIMHTQCPQKPGSGCKRCGKMYWACTCGVS
jgi:hypothetical protein